MSVYILGTIHQVNMVSTPMDQSLDQVTHFTDNKTVAQNTNKKSDSKEYTQLLAELVGPIPSYGNCIITSPY